MSELMIIDINVNDLNDAYNQELVDEVVECTPAISQSADDHDIFLHGGASLTDNFHQELERICRCCASETDDLNSIFDPDDYVASMLTLLTSIEPKRDDGLPTKICLHCLDLLAKSTNFKQRVETADRMFRHLIAMNICQAKALQKDDLEQLSTNTPKTNDLDMIIVGSDVKLQEADNIEYIEDNSIEISPPDEDVQSLPPPEPQPCSNVETENEEIIVEESKRTNYDTKKKDRRKHSKRTKTKKMKKKDRIAFECTMCEKTFSDPKMYVSHVKTHPENKALYWCAVCSRNFKDRTTMEHHFRCHRNNEIEDSTKEFKCEDCEMSFSVEHDLYVHGSIHEKGNKFVCRKCEKEFPNVMKLKRHVRIHYEDKPYKCEMCGKGFPEMASLTRHFRLHTGEKKERKHICNTCGKSYYDSHSLSVHKRTHTGEKPWVCKVCSKGFIDSRLLNSHLKTHQEEKMYACDRCGKRFTHQSTLTTHIRVHTGEKPYVCYICNKSFIQSSNLNLHMRSHSGEKPYQCKLCKRSFASSSTLTTHMRTHTGEKPYSCPQCDKTFARHDLSAHIRTHTGEKPFCCEICTRKFTTFGQLSQHKRSHSEEKPFTCKICDRSWSSSSYLKKHLRTCHTLESEQQNFPVEKLSNFDDNAQVLSIEEGEFQSDSELSDHAVLVNDLLAAVVDSSVDNVDNNLMCDVDHTIDSNILIQ